MEKITSVSVRFSCGALLSVNSYRAVEEDGERKPARLIPQFQAGSGLTAGIGFISPEEARMMAGALIEMADFAEAAE